MLLSSNVAYAASFTVTTTADSNAGSFRQAILDANDSQGLDVIDFDIPAGSCSAAGVCAIVLSTLLPEITDAVQIDGTTQPRFGDAPSNVCATRIAPSYMRVQVEYRPNTREGLLVVSSSGPSTIRGLSVLSDVAVAVKTRRFMK